MMLPSKILISILGALFLFQGSLVTVSAADLQKNLEIGVVLRLKDRFNDTVSGIKLGIEAAKELFEKENPGVRIHFKFYPHGEKIEEVVAATEKVLHDKLSAVIGGELTEESLVLRDQFEGKKVVWITPTSTNPKVTIEQKYGFRVCVSDEKVASDLAHFTAHHLKPKAIGMIHNISSPYTDFQSKHFLDAFSKEMKKNHTLNAPIFEERVLSTTLDYEQQIKLFKEKNVTHLVIFTHPSDLLRFALQARGLGFFPTYIGSDGWGDNAFIYRNLIQSVNAKPSFLGYRNSYWNEELSLPFTVQFKQTYLKKNKTKPTAWGATGFDAAWILMTAMNNAADPRNSVQIREQMEKIQNLSLVTQQNFSFGPDHAPRIQSKIPVPIYRIDQKGIHFEESHL